MNGIRISRLDPIPSDWSEEQLLELLTNGLFPVTSLSNNDTYKATIGLILSYAKKGLISSESIAPKYNTNVTYSVNSFVVYEDILYRCKENNTTGEWNENKWDAITTTAIFTGATEQTNGKPGLVPVPSSAQRDMYLKGDGTWDNPTPDLTDYVSNEDLGHLIVSLYTNKTYNQGDLCIYNKKLYQCIANISQAEEWNPSHWQEVTLTQIIQESNKLRASITASITVGGIEAGDSFAAGTNYDDMFNALLNPALYPTLTNPEATLNYTVEEYYEVKSTISARTATIIFDRGSINPSYGTSGYRSGAVTNYALSTSGADTEYSSSSANSNTFNVSALTRTNKGNIVMTATVSYAAGEQPKDSKGNNYSNPLAAGSKTATKTMQFIQAYYYGKSANASISNFNGLNKSVTIKGQKQFSYTTDNEHMVVAYDSSYGDLTSILDQNGFETISGWTKSTLTVDGFSYYVYVANSATTDTNALFTFKY